MELLKGIEDQYLVDELKDRGYSVLGKQDTGFECSRCGGKMYYVAEVHGNFHYYKIGTRCDSCKMFVGEEGHFD